MYPEAILESSRLSRLKEYALLDIERTPNFDRIVELVAQFLEVPRSAISLLAEDRRWFLAKCGIDADETPRDISFCHHTIAHPDDIFVVEDAHADPRFCHNPLVTGPMAVRFYAGALAGSHLGTAGCAMCD
ncbi:MAG: GAF domain-containing protein [Betaproteobacteria bacterium]